MLEKEEFIKYVKCYEDAEEYIDKLADLNINIWENEALGWLRDSYVELLCKVMDVEPGKGHDWNIIESMIYEDSANPEEVYNSITGTSPEGYEQMKLDFDI